MKTARHILALAVITLLIGPLWLAIALAALGEWIEGWQWPVGYFDFILDVYETISGQRA